MASTDPCSAYVICTPAKPPSGHNKPVNSVPFHGDYSSAILFPASSLTVTQTNSTSLPSATCLSKGIFEIFRLKYRLFIFKIVNSVIPGWCKKFYQQYCTNKRSCRSIGQKVKCLKNIFVSSFCTKLLLV